MKGTGKIIMLCMICISMATLGACSKSETKDIENKSADAGIEIENTKAPSTTVADRKLKLEGELNSKNDVFTKKVYLEIQKFIVWYEGKAVEIKEDADIEKIFKLLSSVKMEKYKPSVNEMKYGYSIMDITTLDETYHVGILEKEFMVNGTNYKVDKNVVEDIRKVVLKYIK